MSRLLRCVALLAGGLVIAIVAVASIVLLVAAAAGVLTTPPGAWVLHARLAPGISIRISVPGLARFAVSPTGLRLLDRRSIETRYGVLRFARDDGVLLVTCAPCEIDAPKLAAQPIRLERLRLRLAQTDSQTLAGELTSGDRGAGLSVSFVARLQPQRIDIDWRIAPTEIAAAYRLFAGVIPEAHLARIEGRIGARGSLRLPQRRAAIDVELDGFAVAGLGTEALAQGPGPVAFTCDGRSRRIVHGEGRWISPSQSGALLAAAVLAAEDQRFHEHAGFDRDEIASLLADIDAHGLRRGASTITQQLARTLFTGAERTGARKLRELLYAVEMERTLDKRTILALYLNTVDWGPGICGADAAARNYFGKRPQQLTPLEAAWLAGILRNPAQAYAREYLAGAAQTDRAQWVLRRMRELPKTERERWARQALVFAEGRRYRELPNHATQTAPSPGRFAATLSH